MQKSRAILFMAWGERYINEMLTCITESVLPDYPIFLISDESTPVDVDSDRLSIIRGKFTLNGETAQG